MKTLAQRFERLHAAEPTSGCWLWQAALHTNGYGLITVGGRSRLAHRVAYEMFVGPIPEGMQLDHKCRVRSCVNPEHLEAVSARENVRRSENANRKKRACWRGHALDDDNTYVDKRLRRHCRACHNERERRHRAEMPPVVRPQREITPKAQRETVVDRFVRQTTLDKSGCWLWIGFVNKRWGYGNFSLGGRSRQAHRVSHELFLGPIPPGMVVHHRCAVRACVNPEHLEAMPQRANLMEAPTSHASRNATKVICIRGHRGTFVRDRSGHRHCKVCNRLRQRAYRARPPQEG